MATELKFDLSSFDDSVQADENAPLISSRSRQQHNYGPSGSLPRHDHKFGKGKHNTF